ncbi:ribonuclease H2 subunit B isoform X2 [Wolffia australiana]
MSWFDGLEGKETRVMIFPCLPSSSRENSAALCGENAGGESGNADGCIMSLRHPKSGAPTCYVHRNGLVHELHWFKQGFGSWFLGDYVSEDGSLFIATGYDPIFLFLPIFEEARMKKSHDEGMFRELNEILFVEGYPAYHHLLSTAENCMGLVCEVKEIGSSRYFRLNDSKVLAWLCCKVNNVKATLLTLDKNFAVREDSETSFDAVSLLGEYINDTWLKALCSHIGIDMDDVARKTPKRETLPLSTEEQNPHSSHQNGNLKRSNSKSTKKSAPIVESKNIRSMFMRAAKNVDRNLTKG